MVKKVSIKSLVRIVFVSIIIEFILSNIFSLSLLFNNTRNYNSNYKLVNDIDGAHINIETNGVRVQNVKIYYKKQFHIDRVTKYVPSVCVYGMQKSNRKLEPKYTVGIKDVKININSERKTIKLKLDVIGNNIDGNIKKIVINDFGISFLFSRFLIILVLLLTITFVKNINKEIKYNCNNKKQKQVYFIIVLLSCLFSILLSIMACNKVEFMEKEILFYDRNFINAEVESVLHGSKSLIMKPSPDFLKLKNPYDTSLRQKNHVSDSAYIDYSYYKGKFYSYFGVVPMFLLMLPIKYLTGYYMTNFFASMIFLTLLIIVFSKLYKMIVNKTINSITFFNYILGFITIFFSSSILLLNRGMAYDIEIECAILCTMISLIIALSIDNNKQSIYKKLAILSIFMGMIVLSKPSFIVYYILIIYILLKNMKKIGKKIDKKGLIVFMIPISLLAIFQMWYNYIRFDSILNFGEIYQITAFDMKNITNYSIIKILKALCHYLFTLPQLNFSKFPFIFIKNYNWLNSQFNVMLYDTIALGIFALPISWIFIFYNRIKHNIKLPKNLINVTNITLITLFIILLLNIRNGISELYVIDIKLFLYLLAVIIFFKILEDKKYQNFTIIFYAICIFSIVISLPIDISLGEELFHNISKPVEVILKNIFEFWL